MIVSGGTLELKPYRQLALDKPMSPGLPSHLAAGSGMTCSGETLHVIADDALELGVFRTDGQAPGKLFELFARPPLPADHKERKKLKPDLESSTLLRHDGQEYWVSVGSGSSERRMTGVCVKLAPDGTPQQATEFDLKPLYEHLQGRFADLNIEGLAPVSDRGKLRLAQRGNSQAHQNAVVDLDLEKAFEAARAGGSWGPELLHDVVPVELPTLPGSQGPVPLTLTDLAPLDGSRLLFTAAAEDTENPYDDGQVLGSQIGVMEADGTVSRLYPVDQRVKLEGICAQPGENGVRTLVVTDADDPEQCATVYETWLVAE